MFRQLVAEWREQAKRYRGNRRHVFTLCAEQLEETIVAAESEQREKKVSEAIVSALEQNDSSLSDLSQTHLSDSRASSSKSPNAERGSLDARPAVPEDSDDEQNLLHAVQNAQADYQDACVVVLKLPPDNNK